MDVEAAMSGALRKVAANTHYRAEAALRRIEELTPTEWTEVSLGLREHPADAAARRNEEARLAARRRADGQVEAFGAALRAMHDGMVRFAQSLRRGWERAGR